MEGRAAECPALYAGRADRAGAEPGSDRLVIDRHVRFAGDVVAILAGRDEACVDKAMKLVKVEYDVLEPVLDFRTAAR